MLINDNDIERAIKLYKECRAAGRSDKPKLRLDRNGDRIEFHMTFEEWIGVWLESGHWHERGCKRDQYVMSRINDLGHYAVGNVFIQKQANNARDSSLGIAKPPRSKEHAAKISLANKGRSPHNKGKPMKPSTMAAVNSPESITKRIAAFKAHPRKICPHCGVEGRGGAMKRFHFDRCKQA